MRNSNSLLWVYQPTRKRSIHARTHAFLALASLLPLTASAVDNSSARRYRTSETLSVQNARLGEVLMVRSVDIKSDKRLNAGSAIGAAVGYGA
ncbi:hypothetical protein PUV44_18585 [Xanthomonas arboricola pv. corylina]|nr:hypothetical protein PUV44_18585 [Xanthomonas arboricola pv. corylina]